MTLRDIKLEVLKFYRLQGHKPTWTQYRRQLRDAVHYEMGRGFAPKSAGTFGLWKGTV